MTGPAGTGKSPFVEALAHVTIKNPTGPLLDVDDFSCGSLDGMDWRQWLDLIRHHTKEYRPSPYQQLAAVERVAGHDGNARAILIAQQQDLRRRAPHALGGWLTRRFHGLWGALAGYGYRARRTALALLIALIAAGGVAVWAGHVTTGPGRYAAEHTITTPTPSTPCSTVELVGLGLDRGLPLAQPACAPAATWTRRPPRARCSPCCCGSCRPPSGDWPHWPSPATPGSYARAPNSASPTTPIPRPS